MKRLLPILLLLTSNAWAFDSVAWQERRAMQTAEAIRLRAAYSNCVARLQTPATDVTVPVDTFPDGAVKSVIFAKKAQYFLDSGFVWAEGVTVRKFKKDGTLDIQIDAKNCVVDRFTKSGWADGPATIVQGKTRFSGCGVYFSSPESYVKVFAASDVDAQDLKFGGAMP